MKLFRRAVPWTGTIASLGAIFLFVVGLWLAWIFWGVGQVSKAVCTGETDCGKLGQVGDLFGGVNALFAGLALAGLIISLELTRRANAQERSRNRDRELLDQILKSYGWAYEAFTRDTDRGVVMASQLNWLVAARHLLRAKRLVDQISSSTYRTIQQEHEEHWRTQFYRQADSAWLLDPGYYFESGDKKKPLDISAAIVIADFMAWKEDVGDPIDDIDPHELMLKTGFTASYLGRGIRLFISEHRPAFAAKLDELIQRGKPPEEKK